MANGSHIELELKLRVPEQSAHAVQSRVDLRGKAAATHLEAVYYDTPDHRLAAAGMGWRVRREGGQWVQTLKAQRSDGGDGMGREEHNVAVRSRRRPDADAIRHAGTPGGERLLALLADLAEQPTDRFRTDVRRLSRRTRVPGGTVELAFDRGRIIAADRHVSVCELEIELVSGRPHAVIAAARGWVQRHGLWIDTLTKSHRGTMLADDATMAEHVRTPTPRLRADMSVDAAVREMMRACLVQVMGNSSAVAGGLGDDEHVHQARIGIRKLRTVLSVFGRHVDTLDPSWQPRLAEVFTVLGAGRDRTVVLTQWADALRDAGAPPITPPLADAADPGDIFRSAPYNLLLLELLDHVHGAPVDDDQPLVDVVAKELQRLRRRCLSNPKRFPRLAETEQHDVRKRLKRLRYVAELTASLFPAKASRRYVRSLAPAQEVLGTLNDLGVAIELYREVVPHDPTAWFAVGWLTSRRASAVKQCVSPLRDAAAAKRYWRD
ncbi:MAG: CHAD domain-containing protein [Actinomycetota bacterium]